MGEIKGFFDQNRLLGYCVKTDGMLKKHEKDSLFLA